MPVQGLADTFILLGMPFDSAEAKQLNKEIFETIYFAALETSCALAKRDGGALFCCCTRLGKGFWWPHHVLSVNIE